MSSDSLPTPSAPPWLGLAALGAAGLLYLLTARNIRARSPRLLDFLLEASADEAWLRDLIERT